MKETVERAELKIDTNGGPSLVNVRVIIKTVDGPIHAFLSDASGRSPFVVAAEAIYSARSGKIPLVIDIRKGWLINHRTWGIYVSIDGQVGTSPGDINDLKAVCNAALEAATR